MERFSSTSVRDSLRGSKRSGYNGNYYDTSGSTSGGSTPTRKHIKSVRFGDANKNHEGSKGDQTSSFKLWRKMKDGYYNMMISLGGNGATAFGDKRTPKAHAASEFDKRLVQEIYKSMSTTS
ncbi:hypothetical protein DCAR_0729751 [Daucus carota subsp. sativus]|uniref:Uncharacterized protein n=1 Tax=Daucus carota subsp. sativus TaxID=79200 RepID=A0A164UFM9_DAUCS|nr:hypothetical protein DCAR_0729751 [Daucus carota subsp. sativus]